MSEIFALKNLCKSDAMRACLVEEVKKEEKKLLNDESGDQDVQS